MTGAERGFLLLGSTLGDPERRPLSTAQLRNLGKLVQNAPTPTEDRELSVADLMAVGCGRELAERIWLLLSQEDVLEHYVRRGAKNGCVPVTRVSEAYPARLKEKLAGEAPGVLWAKGDLGLLDSPMVALVGSRDIRPENKDFAEEVGRQAARQGFALVSGNARGSDRIAQRACLRHGGKVIVVVADELEKQPPHDRVLYLSEEDFDGGFSAQRALRRNRVIHALTDKTFVAQSSLETGGTWDGTVKNLNHGWSSVFCYQDGSESVGRLIQMGAQGITAEQLQDINGLTKQEISLFDR